MKYTIIALMAGMFVATTASARTMDEVEQTCPACTNVFDCMMDMSGFQSGMRLDLRPLGPTPSPWSLAVCPKCHFVLYAEEIPDEELARCREIIATKNYLKKIDRASYYLLGLLYEGIGKEPGDIAHVFLKASWQEEDDNVKLTEDLERSLGYCKAHLEKSSGEADENYQTIQILTGELLRRLGRFDEARVHLVKMQSQEAFQDTFIGKIVGYEIRLCDEKDSAPHAVEEMEIDPEQPPQPEPVIIPNEGAMGPVTLDHIVYPGEKLEHIAKQYGVPEEVIRDANGMSAGDEVKEGQRIKIPIQE